MENFITSNFYFAAALVASGHPIIQTDTSDSKHIRFEFKSEGIASIMNLWDAKTLVVNAREYAEALREVKMKLHQI